VEGVGFYAGSWNLAGSGPV